VITDLKKLGANHFARCPECNRPIAFFVGAEGAFISEEKVFMDDTPVPMTCPTHGVFHVLAGKFQGGEPSEL